MRRAEGGRAWLAPLSIFVVAAAIRLGWTLRGVRAAGDTASYLRLCDEWRADPLTTIQAHVGLETSTFAIPFCATTSWIGLPSSSWVAWQLLLSSLGVLWVFLAAREIGGPRAGWTAGVLAALCWEAFQWDAYILTDSYFAALVSLALWRFVRSVHAQRSRGLFYTSILLVALARPVGPFYAIALLVVHEIARPQRGWARAGPWIAGALALAAYATLGGRTRTYVGEGFLIRAWSSGQVVWDDPAWQFDVPVTAAESMFAFALVNAPVLALLGALKIVALHWPVAARFSLAHNAVNLLYLLPIVILACARLVRMGRAALRSPFVAVWAGASVITAITFVDFDWRYRAPLMGAWIALAALELATYGWLWRGLRSVATLSLGFPAATAPRVDGDELRARVRGRPDNDIDEAAVPSYAHAWWSVRSLFYARLDVALAYLGDVRGQQVLDLGSGTGLLADALGARGARVVGVDLRPMPACAPRHAPVRATLERLPVLDASVDALVATDVLEHVSDVRLVVAEARRVLRPGGAFVVSVPSESRLYRALRRVLGYPSHYHVRTGQAVLDAVRAGGFARDRARSLPRGVRLFTVVRFVREKA